MADDQKKPYREDSIGSKVAIVLGAVVGIGAVIYGLYLFSNQESVSTESAVRRTRPAAVTSARAGQVTQDYAQLNTTRDNQQFEEAERRGTSAVPSVIGTAGYITNPSSFAENASSALNNKLAKNAVCTPEYAKKAREAGVSAFELKCQGCQASVLLSAGYTAGELAKGGYLSLIHI